MSLVPNVVEPQIVVGTTHVHGETSPQTFGKEHVKHFVLNSKHCPRDVRIVQEFEEVDRVQSRHELGVRWVKPEDGGDGQVGRQEDHVDDLQTSVSSVASIVVHHLCTVDEWYLKMDQDGVKLP